MQAKPGRKLVRDQEGTQAQFGSKILFQPHTTLKIQEGHMASPLQPRLGKLLLQYYDGNSNLA